jgi:hypothetical protein
MDVPHAGIDVMKWIPQVLMLKPCCSVVSPGTVKCSEIPGILPAYDSGWSAICTLSLSCRSVVNECEYMCNESMSAPFGQLFNSLKCHSYMFWCTYIIFSELVACWVTLKCCNIHCVIDQKGSHSFGFNPFEECSMWLVSKRFSHQNSLLFSSLHPSYISCLTQLSRFYYCDETWCLYISHSCPYHVINFQFTQVLTAEHEISGRQVAIGNQIF